jgi:hypothetical protein
MADYRELLRKAVDALPENTGQARRDVYEKARQALVAQLRAIDPPLPSREITQHRLQLEDCIRQVEQEATEIALGGIRAIAEASGNGTVSLDPEKTPNAVVSQPEPAEPVATEPAKPDPAPAPVTPPPTTPSPAAVTPPTTIAPVAVTPPPPQPTPVASQLSPGTESGPAPASGTKPKSDLPEWARPRPDEAAAPAGSQTPSEPQKPKDPEAEELASEASKEPSPAAEADPAWMRPPESKEAPEVSGSAPSAQVSASVPAPEIEVAPARDSGGSIEEIIAEAERARTLSASRPETPPDNEPDKLSESAPYAPGPTVPPSGESGELATANPPVKPEEPATGVSRSSASEIASRLGSRKEPQVSAAMSSVREVDVDEEDRAAQSAIDRAIETLDREARGDTSAPAPTDTVSAPLVTDAVGRIDAAVSHGSDEELEDEDTGRGGGNALTIFLILLVLLLGGGGAAAFWAWQQGYLDPDKLFAQVTSLGESEQVTPVDDSTPTGPGNTTTTNGTELGADELPKAEDRLDAVVEEPETVSADETDTSVVAETETPGANGASDEIKTEDRLPGSDATSETGTAAVVEDVTAGGTQSLLLEATAAGQTGAIPFSGTIDWSRGIDELGVPTIVATASIPARNLEVEVLIRKNSDTTLPASHLMEINFSVSDTFVGGAIAGLPGVLLKNEELVQGVPLVGASARVVGNSFLFALSGAAQDVVTNLDLLANRKWMDLAMIYATGRRAIITLEKDQAAEEIFAGVLAEWQAIDAANAPVVSLEESILEGVDDGAPDGGDAALDLTLDPASTEPVATDLLSQ